MAITLASFSGVSRICRIAAFSGDGLVKSLLRLKKGINENSISAALKNLENLLKAQTWADIRTNTRGVWARCAQVAQNQVNQMEFVPNGQRIQSIQGWS